MHHTRQPVDDGGRGLQGGVEGETGGGVSNQGACLRVWPLGQLDRGHCKKGHRNGQTGREGVLAGWEPVPAAEGEEEGAEEEGRGANPGGEVVVGAL